MEEISPEFVATSSNATDDDANYNRTATPTVWTRTRTCACVCMPSNDVANHTINATEAETMYDGHRVADDDEFDVDDLYVILMEETSLGFVAKSSNATDDDVNYSGTRTCTCVCTPSDDVANRAEADIVSGGDDDNDDDEDDFDVDDFDVDDDVDDDDDVDNDDDDDRGTVSVMSEEEWN